MGAWALPELPFIQVRKMRRTGVGFSKCELQDMNSASAQNTIVALHREYTRYHYLYFTTGRSGGKKEIDKRILMMDQETKHFF